MKTGLLSYPSLIFPRLILQDNTSMLSIRAGDVILAFDNCLPVPGNLTIIFMLWDIFMLWECEKAIQFTTSNELGDKGSKVRALSVVQVGPTISFSHDTTASAAYSVTRNIHTHNVHSLWPIQCWNNDQSQSHSCAPSNNYSWHTNLFSIRVVAARDILTETYMALQPPRFCRGTNWNLFHGRALQTHLLQRPDERRARFDRYSAPSFHIAIWNIKPREPEVT